MSIASIVTRGFIDGVNFIPTRGYNPGTAPIPPTIIGGHFIPSGGKRKHVLSNVQVIYEKAKELPRKETKELRDAIAEFVAPEVARVAQVPDLYKVDYAALEANTSAYQKFAKALTNIQERMELMEAVRFKQQQEDDDLMTFAIIASLIH